MGLIEKIVVDDATFRRLEQLARSRGRTVAEEAAAILDGSRVQMDRNEFVRRAAEIAALTPGAAEQADSTLLIREDRDR